MTVESWSELVYMLPTYALRLGVALVCGLLLGVERERKDKPAGLRTIVLISFGSALFMIAGNLVPYAYEWTDLTRVDPSRIASNVVTGIGFLGAGTIIQGRGSIQGLTTAAVIWVSAAIGMCAGLGAISLAIGSAVIVVIALVAMDPLRGFLIRFGTAYNVEITAPDDSLALRRILYVLDGHDVSRDEMDVQYIDDNELQIGFVYRGSGGAALRLIEAVSRIEGVHGSRLGDAEAIRRL